MIDILCTDFKKLYKIHLTKFLDNLKNTTQLFKIKQLSLLYFNTETTPLMATNFGLTSHMRFVSRGGSNLFKEGA